MAFPGDQQASAPRSATADPFAEQLQLSRIHTRLVPMRRSGIGYAIEPATADWFELPASRGFAGYGLGRALGLLLDAMRGLSALHGTATANGEPFAHGEFAPLNFRVDPLGICRLVPLTTRHYISEEVAPPRAALGFLSPERLIAEKVGVRADVFSAGVLLWEALSGRRLMDAQNSEAVIERLLSKKLRVPQLPPQLAWAAPLKLEVERALSVNQQQRFADCEEFSAIIRRIAQDHVASHDEIAAFFAASLKPPQATSPSSPPSSPPNSSPASPSSSPPSSVPLSHERRIAGPGATLRMLPCSSNAEPAVHFGPAEGGPLRHATLKMSVTLKMAPVQLPIAVAAPLAPARVAPPPRALTPPSTPAAQPESLPPVMTPPPRRSSPPPLPPALPPPPPPPALAPPPPPRLTPTTPVPTLQSSLPRATPPPLPAITTPVTGSSAAPGTARRRWIAAALLLVALVGGGLLARRGVRNADAFTRSPAARAVPLPTARAAVASSPPAPSFGSEAAGEDAPPVEEQEKKDVSAVRVAPTIPPLPTRVAPRAAAAARRDYGI